MAEASKYKDTHDDELTAAQLRLKYSYSESSSHSGINGNAAAGDHTKNADLLSGLHDATSDGNSGGDVLVGTIPIDTSLFGGLEFAMTNAEQRYVTDLMTSEDVDQIAQATQILASIAFMSRKGITPSVRSGGPSGPITNTVPSQLGAAHARVDTRGRTATSRGMRSGYSGSIAVGRALAMSRTDEDIKKEYNEARIEQHRRHYPLPARMPRFVTLDSPAEVDPASKKFPLMFADDEWDGSIEDAFSRVHISMKNRKVRKRNGNGSKSDHEDESGGHDPLSPDSHASSDIWESSGGPQRRVVVARAKGKASGMGIQKGDVVTHLNGERFIGNKDDLINALRRICIDADATTFSLVVNAEPAVAEAIRRRALITESKTGEW